MAKIRELMLRAIILLIKFYRLVIRPVIGDHCRFTPSCSSYAIEALNYCGICKGLYLIIKRLLRCHPFTNGGFDPINKS